VLNEVEKELKNILNKQCFTLRWIQDSRAGLWPSLLSIGINNAILLEWYCCSLISWTAQQSQTRSLSL